MQEQNKRNDRERLKYVRWLLYKMCMDNADSLMLYLTLLDIDFYWCDTYRDDANRAADARTLREDYIYTTDEPLSGLSSVVSVLEVLVAMAERATPISYDYAYVWFNNFITNLGLDGLTDDYWTDDSENYVRKTIRKWLDRRFSPNGVGSPFRSNGTYDVTKESMWNALQWYLADTYGEGHI